MRDAAPPYRAVRRAPGLRPSVGRPDVLNTDTTKPPPPSGEEGWGRFSLFRGVQLPTAAQPVYGRAGSTLLATYATAVCTAVFDAKAPRVAQYGPVHAKCASDSAGPTARTTPAATSMPKPCRKVRTARLRASACADGGITSGSFGWVMALLRVLGGYELGRRLHPGPAVPQRLPQRPRDDVDAEVGAVVHGAQRVQVPRGFDPLLERLVVGEVEAELLGHPRPVCTLGLRVLNVRVMKFDVAGAVVVADHTLEQPLPPHPRLGLLEQVVVRVVLAGLVLGYVGDEVEGERLVVGGGH